MTPSFQTQPLVPGVLFDFGHDRGAVQAFGSCRRDHPSLFTSAGSFIGFVSHGRASIETLFGSQTLPAGSYFAAQQRCIVSGGAGIVIEIPGHQVPELSGEVNHHQRLAGGPSIMLVPPGARGGPFLSAAFLLPGTAFEPYAQAFTPPFAGLVAAGTGTCGHEQGAALLREGQAFIVRGRRCTFRACHGNSLTLILYQPRNSTGGGVAPSASSAGQRPQENRQEAASVA